MNSQLISLIVLLAIAAFLFLRLRSVLGTRDGFERPRVPKSDAEAEPQRDFEVIEGGFDRDITDHVEPGSESAEALAAMKAAEPGFGVSDFLAGARAAHEMILMGFETGDLDDIRSLLSDDVRESFEAVIEARNEQGLTIDAAYVGLRELNLQDARFDAESRTAEITMRYLGELTWVVRDASGAVVEGDANEIKRQRDIWTFARRMGGDDPNWVLIATDG